MRLGDLDALKDILIQRRSELTGVAGDLGGALSGVIKLIDNAPTVIVDNCGKCPYYKDSDRDIITEAYNDGYKTAKEDFENHKLVNNSQELVKDLVKEKSERPQGEWIIQRHDLAGCFYTCSNCGRMIRVPLFIDDPEDNETLADYPFCHCGASMRGGEKE